MESFVIWGIAVLAIAQGAVWLRTRKLAFMAWPAFGVAGAVAGYQLDSQRLTYWSLGLSAIAMVAQIVYDGWKRER
jgi:hypothetical protein